jgi:hypothetical protein
MFTQLTGGEMTETDQRIDKVTRDVQALDRDLSRLMGQPQTELVRDEIHQKTQEKRRLEAHISDLRRVSTNQ